MAELTLLQDRIVQLEECVSHQDHLLEQLNEVILQLRTQSDQLRLHFDREINRLETLLETKTGDPYPDEKPPHY